VSYTPTDVEGQALHQLAIALRPDWEPNNPGNTWYTKTRGTFPHAQNYVHCIDALIHYATKSDPRKRTPDIYPEDGKHWDATRPAPEVDRPGREPICQDHTAYNARTCPVCSDEIRTKHRSPQQRGKRIRQVVPSPGILKETSK
jgi:hypothetical protein